MDVAALLYGYSKALYSNWLFYKPDNLLIDCGEGVATTLGNGGYAIERVLLTHGHIDHIAGLPSLIWSRAGGMGDTDKPLTIYYPAGDSYVADLRAYLLKTSSRLPFELSWIELEAGAAIDLTAPGRHARRIAAFATEHIAGRLTLGYKVVETRTRLRSEYAALGEEELRRRARAAGRGERTVFSEDYDATLIAFGGDGLPLRPEDVMGAEVLVHEATLLDAADRKHQSHSTLDEAVEAGKAARPGMLLLNHFSGRYRDAEIRDAVRHAAQRHGTDFAIWSLVRDKIRPCVNAGSPALALKP